MPATHGKGSTLLYGTYSIGQLTSINGVEINRETIDVTTLAEDFREYIGGLADGGTVNAVCHYDPKDAGQVAALAAINAGGAAASWSITLPTSISASWGFLGVVTTYNVAIPLGDKLGLSLGIKVSGKPVLTI